MRPWLIFAAALIPGAALATEPFEGIWAAEPDWCAFADRIGSHDPAPVRITATEIAGLENTCHITAIEARPDENLWHLTLACEGEGQTYDERTTLMLGDENTLWRWYGAGEPLRFTRCTED